MTIVPTQSGAFIRSGPYRAQKEDTAGGPGPHPWVANIKDQGGDDDCNIPVRRYAFQGHTSDAHEEIEEKQAKKH